MQQAVVELQKQHEETKQVVIRLHQASSLLQSSIEDQKVVVNDFLEQRRDVQEEIRVKKRILADLEQEYLDVKEELDSATFTKKDSQRSNSEDSDAAEIEDLHAANAYDFKRFFGKITMEERMDAKQKKLELEAKRLIAMKAKQLRNQASHSFKQELNKKFENIKEQPLSILKRLDNHIKDSSAGAAQFNGGTQQSVPAVVVKVLKSSLYPLKEIELDSNATDSEAEADKSESQPEARMIRKSHKKKSVKQKEREERQKQIDADPTSYKYQFFQQTFRISKNLDVRQFLKIVCDFWGLDPRKFDFFDDNGEKISIEDMMIQGQRYVEKMMESLVVKEFKDRDLFPNQPRKFLLYLGEDSFETIFRKLMQAKRVKMEEEKEARKLLRNQQRLLDDDDDRDSDEEEYEMDKEEDFLRKFPLFSSHYRNNKELFRKQSKKPGFDIRYAGWLMPTCCSMLVNVIQLFLTLTSIMNSKNSWAVFWLPEMVRSDLKTNFTSIESVDDFWSYLNNDIAQYLFQEPSFLDDMNSVIPEQLVHSYIEVQGEDGNQEQKQAYLDRRVVGAVRILQKRVQKQTCRRASNVERYKKVFSQDCYYTNFEPGIEEKEPITTAGTQKWGKFKELEQTDFRFTQGFEYLRGHFGNYFLNSGYIQDVFPYQMIRPHFREQLNRMKTRQFVQVGATKAINIDFSLAFPSSGYFVNVNMLVEFTQQGQAIPTRFDAQPFKMSPFATHNHESAAIDVLIFLLVIYTTYVVVQNFTSLSSFSHLLKYQTIKENFVDLMIIFIQTFSFSLKIMSKDSFDMDVDTLYTDQVRLQYYPLHFVSTDFNTISALETIALIFILTKVVEGLRFFHRLNVILTTVIFSVDMILVFISLYVAFQITLVPLAQAIWGYQLIGYKTFKDAVGSVFMIAYSKGNLETLLDLNVFWSFIFILLYYIYIFFIMHAAFHNNQTDALKHIVLLYSLNENDVVKTDEEIEKEKVPVPVDAMQYQRQKLRESTALAVRILQWFFGWLPRNHVKQIGKLNELIPDSSDDEGDIELSMLRRR